MGKSIHSDNIFPICEQILIIPLKEFFGCLNVIYVTIMTSRSQHFANLSLKYFDTGIK